MKNSKGTKRLVSGIPRANDGCQHFPFPISHFPFFIFHFFRTHFCAASEPKTSICLAGGLPTDGNADLRISTFAACGFESKTVNVSARKLDHGSPTNCCRSRKCPGTVHPQFGFAIRLNYQTLAFCRFAAQAIRRLRTFGVLTDSTLGVLELTTVRHAQIGKLFPDNSLRVGDATC
jgi:hypothetical protein